MTALTTTIGEEMHTAVPVDHVWRRLLRSGRFVVGGGTLIAIVLLSIFSLPWTLNENSAWYFNLQQQDLARTPPASTPTAWFGFDNLGRSMLSRTLLGGTCSLVIGLAAAAISVALGVTVGLISGYRSDGSTRSSCALSTSSTACPTSCSSSS